VICKRSARRSRPTTHYQLQSSCRLSNGGLQVHIAQNNAWLHSKRVLQGSHSQAELSCRAAFADVALLAVNLWAVCMPRRRAGGAARQASKRTIFSDRRAGSQAACASHAVHPFCRTLPSSHTVRSIVTQLSFVQAQPSPSLFLARLIQHTHKPIGSLCNTVLSPQSPLSAGPGTPLAQKVRTPDATPAPPRSRAPAEASTSPHASSQISWAW
jgi:hypothetical protein